MARLRSPLHLSRLLLLLTFLTGLSLTVAGYLVEPDGGKSFLGFLVIYGWLAVFSSWSLATPSKRRTLLVIGSMPILFVGAASIVLSFPVYVLPAAVIALAIASERDLPRQNST